MAVRESFSCKVVQCDTILFCGPFSEGRYSIFMHVTKQLVVIKSIIRPTDAQLNFFKILKFTLR
jgi:hypothetical protein